MDLTKGSIDQHLRNIAIPASVGFFFNTMFNVVDTYFAGKISTDALAALSISFPIFFIIIALDNGISVGASALISNALGAKKPDEVRLYKAQTFTFGVIFAICISWIGLTISPPLFRILGASGAYLELALSYINVIFLGAVFFVLSASGNAILLAHGNSKTMRNVLILAFVLNCILDPWFLYGGFGVPAMGLRGIALATVTAMVFADIYVIGKVIRDGHLSEVKAKDFIPNIKIFRAILQQTLPAAMNMMSIALGIFFITYYVKSFGTDAVAAYGIGMRVQQIVLLPTIGITVATLSIIGQNNGAGLYDRIIETMKISLKFGMRIMSVGAVIMLFFPTPLMKFFTDDVGVVAIGDDYIRVAAFSSWAFMIMAINNSTLQGMKRPNFPFIVTVLRQTIAPIIVLHIVITHFHLGIMSIWYSILAVTWIATAIVIWYTKRVLNAELARSTHLDDKSS
jgi:MATE family, multidrug efflux pump